METESSSWKKIGGGVCGALALLLVVFFIAYKPQTGARSKFGQKASPHGFTLWGGGTGGKLSCTGGKKIAINDAAYMCALDATGAVNRSCDPFFPNGSYNPATTFDAKSDLEAECKGKTACSFRLPNVYATGETDCDCDFQNVVLNASYYCVPAEK